MIGIQKYWRLFVWAVTSNLDGGGLVPGAFHPPQMGCAVYLCSYGSLCLQLLFQLINTDLWKKIRKGEREREMLTEIESGK